MTTNYCFLSAQRINVAKSEPFSSPEPPGGLSTKFPHAPRARVPWRLWVRSLRTADVSPRLSPLRDVSRGFSSQNERGETSAVRRLLGARMRVSSWGPTLLVPSLLYRFHTHTLLLINSYLNPYNFLLHHGFFRVNEANKLKLNITW